MSLYRAVARVSSAARAPQHLTRSSTNRDISTRHLRRHNAALSFTSVRYLSSKNTNLDVDPAERTWQELENQPDDEYDPNWDLFQSPEWEGDGEEPDWDLEDFTGGGFRRQMPAGYDKFDRVNEEFDEEDEPLPQTKKRASAEIAQNIMAAAPAAAAAAAVPKSAKAVADVDMKNKNHMAGQRYKIGTVNIPKKLKDAMHTILKGYPKEWLKRDSAILSEALRARTTESSFLAQQMKTADADKQQEGGKYRTFNDAQASAVQVNVPPLTYNKQQSMAYVAHRVPGIFGCNVRVFEEIKSRMPDFKPKKMLDFGSGPGTTTWAASTVWDSIKRYVLVEPSEHMQEVSAKMLKDFPVERRRHMNTGRLNDIDLIVASYSLSEMDSDATRRGQVREMWENLVPGGILVFVEPGTPIGFRVIRGARNVVLEMKTGDKNTNPNVLAPCPHNISCPQPLDSWCHFIQRVERTSLLRTAKQASINWENEKFSFVAIMKGPLPVQQAAADPTSPNYGLEESRLIRQPLKRGGHILVDVCKPEGVLERVTVAKSSGKDLFKAARKAAWGDTFFIDRLQTAANQQGKRKQVRFFWGRDQRKRFNQAKDKNQAPKEAFDENKSYAVQVE